MCYVFLTTQKIVFKMLLLLSLFLLMLINMIVVILLNNIVDIVCFVSNVNIK